MCNFMFVLFLLSVRSSAEVRSKKCLCYEMKGKHGMEYVYRCMNVQGSTIPKPEGCNRTITEITITDSNMTIITKDTFSHLNISSVKNLHLVRCNITYIQIDTFSEFGLQLRSMDLSKNHLAKEAISNIYTLGLQELRLNGNPLYWIDASSFHPKLLRSLKTLYLEKCSIEYFGNDTLINLRLRRLFISRNYIVNLEFLRHCHSSKRDFLETLDLAYNSVENTSQFTSMFNSSCLSKLKTLILDGNPLLFQDGDTFSSKTLKNLAIQNLLKETPFPLLDMPRLKNFFMKENFLLEKLSIDLFVKAPNLKFIDMSGSNLSGFSISDMKALFKPLKIIQSLNLSNTSIKGTVGQTFRNLTTLHGLYLGFNNITKISDAFSTLSKLKNLRVNNNNVSVMSLEDLPATSQLKFDFSGNPFHCTCAIADFRIYCGQNFPHVESKDQYYCKGPKEYAGKSFWEFKPLYSDCHGFNPYIITAIVICVFVVILVFVMSFLSSYKNRIKNYLRIRKLLTGYTQISGSSTVQVS